MERAAKISAIFLFILLLIDLFSTLYMAAEYNDVGNYRDAARAIVMTGMVGVVIIGGKVILKKALSSKQKKSLHRAIQTALAITGLVTFISLSLRTAEIAYNYQMHQKYHSSKGKTAEEILKGLGEPTRKTANQENFIVEHRSIDQLWQYCLVPFRNVSCYKFFIDNNKVIHSQASWGPHKFSFILPYLYDWWFFNNILGLTPNPEFLFD